ncbi:MAG: hypothetical protein F6K26_18505 [Moorea sp. SIO2I5]|nr:hypothetical protein [Moorena sp. SIO2I5]
MSPYSLRCAFPSALKKRGVAPLPTPYSLFPVPCSLFPVPFTIVISVINANGVATIPTQLW